MIIACIAVMAVLVLAVLSVTTTIEVRITELDSRIADLEKRLDNVAEAGKILNMEVRELDSHRRMAKTVAPEQVEDAKERAGL